MWANCGREATRHDAGDSAVSFTPVVWSGTCNGTARYDNILARSLSGGMTERRVC